METQHLDLRYEPSTSFYLLASCQKLWPNLAAYVPVFVNAAWCCCWFRANNLDHWVQSRVCYVRMLSGCSSLAFVGMVLPCFCRAQATVNSCCKETLIHLQCIKYASICVFMRLTAETKYCTCITLVGTGKFTWQPKVLMFPLSVCLTALFCASARLNCN